MVGKNIKRLRMEKGMTQEALAEQLNVTRQAVSNWENGKTQPDVESLGQIARILEASVEELIYGEKKNGPDVRNVVKEGIDTSTVIGAALAVVLSYTKWHSIGWAILHGLFNWVYVIYFAIRY